MSDADKFAGIFLLGCGVEMVTHSFGWGLITLGGLTLVVEGSIALTRSVFAERPSQGEEASK